MLKITLRGIRAHVARLVLTTLVVLMGVSFVVSVQVLTDTLKDGIDNAFADAGKGIDVVVRSSESVPSQFGGPDQRAPLGQEVLGIARTSPGLRTVVGLVTEPARVTRPNGELINSAAGSALIAQNWIDDPGLSQWRIVSGRAPAGEGEVVVDAGLSEDRGLEIGTALRIPTPRANESVAVVGVARFGTARNYQGASAVLFATPVAQRMFAEPGKYTMLLGAAAPGVTARDAATSVYRTVGVNRQAVVQTGADYLKETQDQIQRLLGVIGTLLEYFGYLGLFVSSFIIYNTFSIVVAQRSRELALLRALGASRSQIVRSVRTEALVVGALSAVLGVLVGIGMGAAVSSLLAGRGLVPPDAPLSVHPLSYTRAVVVGMLVTVVASLVPARRASRVPPVSAMRQAEVEERNATPARIAISSVLTIGGGASMAAGLIISFGQRTAAIFGGMAAVFLGVAGLGPVIVPAASRLLGRPVQRLRGITGRLAWENAARSPKRSAATSAAVMIGVALVCLIAILGESFRATTTDAIDTAVQADFVVNTGALQLQGVSPDLATELAKVPGVQAVAGLRANLAVFNASPALVLGIDPNAFVQNIRFTVEAGDLRQLGTDGFAVTTDEAKKQHWTVGTIVRASFLGQGPRDLVVRAIFTSELLRGTNGYFLDLALYQQVFPPHLQSDLQVYVKLVPGIAPASVRPALDAAAKQFPPSKIEDLDEFKATRTKPIDNFVFFLWAMLALAVIISMLGIVNTLLLGVVERTREIGLLRAGGMARAQVRSAIRWESVILSVIGAVLGTGVGLFFAWAVVFAFRDEGLRVFALPYVQLVVILATAGVGGVVAAVWPAHRAAKLDILDAIAQD